jgi:hypothetical protein
LNGKQKKDVTAKKKNEGKKGKQNKYGNAKNKEASREWEKNDTPQ